MADNSLKGTNSANRNYNRWHGKRALSQFVYEIPPIDGTAALKDAPKPPRVDLRPKRQYSFMDEMYARAPLKVGTRVHLYIDKMILGIKMLIIGLAEVTDIYWTGHHWLVDLAVGGKPVDKWLRLEEVMEGLVNWWKRRRQQKRSERAAMVGRRTAPLQLLPASEHKLAELAAIKRVAGLLPAKCA